MAKEKEETSDKGLKNLWKLPSDPGDPTNNLASRFLDYESFLRIYRDFAESYRKAGRIWRNSPLYFETDSFLNYLFHHAPGTPTKLYKREKPRSLNEYERQKEIREYASQFKEWISKGSEGVERGHSRDDASRIINKLLDKEKILTIDRNDIKQVIDQLNCMNSLPLNKSRFLNPKNNETNKVRIAWKNLLYGDAPLPVRMNDCKNALEYFGRSSIHELLGFFEPKKFPLRNTNSNAGLRFFGYEVSVY